MSYQEHIYVDFMREHLASEPDDVIEVLATKPLAQPYDTSADEYARSRIGTEDKAELEKLRSLLPAGAKILDIGCAAGRGTRILKDMGFDTVGSDLSAKLLGIAQRQNPDIRFVQADMRKLPFDNEASDAVWASAVLHHIPKTEMPGVLKEFRRVLATGGVLYVHTEAGEGRLHTSEASVQGEEREFELLTANELDAMLSDSGYSKLSLEQKASKSRKGLYWLNAFYRKVV